MQPARISALSLFLLLAIPSVCPAGGPVPAVRWVTFTPMEDTNAVLHNPDMGWVIYENFPEVDAAALMFSWQDIESGAGTYDFSRVDAAYDYWRKRGKTLQLRMSSESLMYWASRNPPAGMGVPDYVLARMAPGERQARTMDGAAYTVVDARNAYYRERLAAFLRAVGEHFDRRRPVTLIDLRGFGAWGEWHSGFRYPDLESRHRALAGILDLWAEALPRHRLALSYSYDPDGPRQLYAGPNNKFDPAFTTNYAEFLRYSPDGTGTNNTITESIGSGEFYRLVFPPR